jgi:hypothetical protein
VITTHGALAAAVHVQSRLVSTGSVPDIPLAGTVPAPSLPTDTVHLLSVGAITEVDVEDPVHAPASTHSIAMAKRRTHTVPQYEQFVCRLRRPPRSIVP